MDDQARQAQQFERARPRLQAVAYRMLGSVSEAEDAVQEAWLRPGRSNDEPIDNLGGWLTTVVGRVCIDMLRARTSRRESYVGTWLPEPIVLSDSAPDPEQEALLAETVGVALLVVLETLTPSERLAFVLHDMFAMPFSEIAPIVGRSPAAARQLASRARRRVRGAAPETEPDPERQNAVVGAFLSASRAGDFDALLAVLDPDVVFRADTGQVKNLVPAQITGAMQVARHASTEGRRFAVLCHPALVNGSAGLVIRAARSSIGAAAFSVVEGRITTIDLVLDPGKLAGIRAP